MKILHLTKYYPPDTGGIETFVQGLAGEQVRLGHAVRVLAHHARSGRATSLERRNGVEVVRGRVLGNIAFAPLSPAFVCHLVRNPLGFAPDIIHVHMPNASALAVVMSGRQNSRVVVHWHADVVTDRQLSLKILYPMYAQFEKRLLASSDRVIATSRQYLETSRPLQSFHDKCSVIPLGLDPNRVPRVDPSRVQALKEVYGSRPLVVAVGRFSYYKGFEHLIRAAVKLQETSVVIVGQGPLCDSCSRLVDELGLKGRVFLPGAVTEADLWHHYASADVVCLPSIERTEAFGMVLLEAMACGKPLVTTKVAGSGMSFVNVHGLTGLQVPPEDPEALAGAVRRLLRDPERAAAMGLAGRKRLHELFTMEIIAQQVEALYATI